MARPIASDPKRRCGVLIGVLLSLPRAAQGEPPPDSVRAQQLFDEARTLMKAERYAEACPMLTESQTLDPGGGTILNLGICHARQGRTATAWSELQKALAQAEADGRQDRVKTARKHLDALAPILSRLRVELAIGAALPGLTIEIDGVPVDTSSSSGPTAAPVRQWELPIDPGTHEVKALAPAHKPWSVRVTIAPVADQRLVQIPLLAPEASASAPSAPVRPMTPVAPPPARSAKALSTSPVAHVTSGPPRWIGYTALGAGAAALGVGTYFAIRSVTLKSDSDRAWDGEYCVRRSCVEDWEDAKTAARAANVSVALGLVALGAGVYLVLRPAPSAGASAVQLSVGALRSGGALRASAEF